MRSMLRRWITRRLSRRHPSSRFSRWSSGSFCTSFAWRTRMSVILMRVQPCSGFQLYLMYVSRRPVHSSVYIVTGSAATTAKGTRSIRRGPVITSHLRSYSSHRTVSIIFLLKLVCCSCTLNVFQGPPSSCLTSQSDACWHSSPSGPTVRASRMCGTSTLFRGLYVLPLSLPVISLKDFRTRQWAHNWIVMFTYLQHSDPTVPYYREVHSNCTPIGIRGS